MDVTDPSAPLVLDSDASLHTAESVAVLGTEAYIAEAPRTLRVIDVAIPSALATLGSIETPGWASDVVASGAVAYVADRTPGLAHIDIGSCQPVEPCRSDSNGDGIVDVVDLLNLLSDGAPCPD